MAKEMLVFTCISMISMWLQDLQLKKQHELVPRASSALHLTVHQITSASPPMGSASPSVVPSAASSVLASSADNNALTAPPAVLLFLPGFLLACIFCISAFAAWHGLANNICKCWLEDCDDLSNTDSIPAAAMHVQELVTKHEQHMKTTAAYHEKHVQTITAAHEAHVSALIADHQARADKLLKTCHMQVDEFASTLSLTGTKLIEALFALSSAEEKIRALEEQLDDEEEEEEEDVAVATGSGLNGGAQAFVPAAPVKAKRPRRNPKVKKVLEDGSEVMVRKAKKKKNQVNLGAENASE